jgi:nicotinamidase-related amidase
VYKPPFDSHLTSEDKIVLETYGYGNGLGVHATSRPAVLVIDTTYMFVGEVREPIAEAVKRRRNACGERAWQAVDALQKVITAARAKGLPIIYTKGDSKPDLGRWGAEAIKKPPKKGNGSLRNLRDDNDIVDEVAPNPGDIVIRKQKPSAFFGTALLGHLVALKIDSLFVTGGATSGCVRGSVVDAFSNNYGCTIIADCCFDRFSASHTMTLFDLGSKYAAVETADEAIGRIAALPEGLFGVS